MKLQMIYLTGTYDSEFTLTTEEVFEWVKTGKVQNEETLKQMTRDAIELLYAERGESTETKEFQKNIEQELEELFDSEDDENDRALKAPGIQLNKELMFFADIKLMMEAVRKHNIEIDKVYEGFIN